MSSLPVKESINLNDSFESENHEEAEEDVGSNSVEDLFSTKKENSKQTADIKTYDLEAENVTCCGNLLSWASKIFDDQKPILVALKFFVTNVIMITSDTLSDIVQFITYIS